MNQLSLIKIIKNHIEVEGEESSFLLILVDCPMGGSSVGGRLSASLKSESRFDCVRCSIQILLTKTVRCNIVLRSIPHCILYMSTTLISPNTNLDTLFNEDTTGTKLLNKLKFQSLALLTYSQM